MKAKEFDKLFDENNTSIVKHLDMSKAARLNQK